jgi:hypothetical protein
MSIVNKQFVYENITNNKNIKETSSGETFTDYTPVKYRSYHGATDHHLGDGLLIYAAIQHLRAKNCVCLGSGGGFIPRIMTQARLDLHDQGIFNGSNHWNWGDIGSTYVVDATNNIGGETDWTDKDSFLRKTFAPRFINDTTENAFYNFFIKEDIKIHFLHIDADHSYQGVKKDFELYSTLLQPGGIITIHDTDNEYEENYTVSEDNKNNFEEFTKGPSRFIKELPSGWKSFNFFNEGLYKTKPSTTGLTFIQHD